MKLHFTLADPAGNRTALVPENEQTAPIRREISRKLMEDCALGIEQVAEFL